MSGKKKASTTILSIFFLSSFLFAGCAHNQPKKWTDYDKSPRQTYNEALGGEAGTKLDIPVKRMNMTSPYKPVITPPETVPIWIYDHVTPDNTMVVGHWIFIKLREAHWYIQDRVGGPSSHTENQRKIPRKVER